MKVAIYCKEEKAYWDDINRVGKSTTPQYLFTVKEAEEAIDKYGASCEEIHYPPKEVEVYTPNTRRLQPGWPSQNKQTK